MTDGQESLAGLSRLAEARTELDRVERRLIEAARSDGVSWSRIAAALGLSSRQAAEQRWLRLSTAAKRDPSLTRAARKRQQIVDMSFGEPIVVLRAVALQALRHIEEDQGWDNRHPRAALIRMSLEAAATAEPGALFELAKQAGTDLQDAFWASLPTTLAASLRRLKQAVRDATPTA